MSVCLNSLLLLVLNSTTMAVPILEVSVTIKSVIPYQYLLVIGFSTPTILYLFFTQASNIFKQANFSSGVVNHSSSKVVAFFLNNNSICSIMAFPKFLLLSRINCGMPPIAMSLQYLLKLVQDIKRRCFLPS